MSSRNGEAIPWHYTHDANSGLSVWRWGTVHFTATIMTNGPQAMSWQVESHLSGPAYLGGAVDKDFVDAESSVRECIGKALPPELGYMSYAGRHATTYVLADGSPVNVAPLVNRRCVVNLITATGAQQTYRGVLMTHHWHIGLRDNHGEQTVFQSRHVASVYAEEGSPLDMTSWTGVGRVYRGKPSRGCTGLHGFLAGTVDHDGSPCPVHERN